MQRNGDRVKIKYDVAFTQAVSPALEAAVEARLRALFQIGLSETFLVGDVLLAAGKRLRIVGRTWRLNESTPTLEYRMTAE